MKDDSIYTPAPEGGRRRVLIAGAAAAGLLGGLGYAWWRSTREDPMEAADLLWTLSFQTPQGTDVAMKSLRGRPMLVNFWATWCPPCVEEMPLLDGFFKKNVGKGWQVVGLAIDQPSAVRTYLQKTPVSYLIGLAGMQGTELTKALGNRTGGLPFTVVVGGDGTVRHRRIGRVTEDDLAQWATLT